MEKSRNQAENSELRDEKFEKKERDHEFSEELSDGGERNEFININQNA